MIENSETGNLKNEEGIIMRESGILMPVSSLPGPYGIGCFGAEALKFVDFLAAAGQHIWQLLPLSPTVGHRPALGGLRHPLHQPL